MPINKVIPLCPTVCCCPEIILKDNQFVIKDDYESKIIIPIDQINDLIKKLDEVISVPGNSLDN